MIPIRMINVAVALGLRVSCPGMAGPQRQTKRGRPAGRPQPGQGRRRLPPLLRRAWFALNQTFRRRIADLGLTPDQYTVLRVLTEHEGGGLTQRELRERMFSDPNTIASLVARMEGTGLLVRERHEVDRRAVRLQRTPLGGQRFEAAQERAAVLQAEVLSGLSPVAQERFLAQLEWVATVCQDALERSRHDAD